MPHRETHDTFQNHLAWAQVGSIRVLRAEPQLRPIRQQRHGGPMWAMLRLLGSLGKR
ncbi:MAG: hypothetical protein JJU06_21470 [Ectothiorhodospiraceae bacterium]|nr:hypothetical protein [Ectothiorhodospiraceae bacterium]MCH8505392.1 hypothetical protein [Ectothiorhodospiraceae bacterium]